MVVYWSFLLFGVRYLVATTANVPLCFNFWQISWAAIKTYTDGV
jgi:hypothetical protein